MRCFLCIWGHAARSMGIQIAVADKIDRWFMLAWPANMRRCLVVKFFSLKAGEVHSPVLAISKQRCGSATSPTAYTPGLSRPAGRWPLPWWRSLAVSITKSIHQRNMKAWSLQPPTSAKQHFVQTPSQSSLLFLLQSYAAFPASLRVANYSNDMSMILLQDHWHVAYSHEKHTNTNKTSANCANW